MTLPPNLILHPNHIPRLPENVFFPRWCYFYWFYILPVCLSTIQEYSCSTDDPYPVLFSSAWYGPISKAKNKQFCIASPTGKSFHVVFKLLVDPQWHYFFLGFFCFIGIGEWFCFSQCWLCSFQRALWDCNPYQFGLQVCSLTFVVF